MRGSKATAATPTPPNADDGAGRERVAVAYSGGRDSTALLHATLASASQIGVEVIALHVHHGLSRQADAWLDHCAAQCARWADEGHRLTFVTQRLAVRPGKGESIEAWARKERYAALHAMTVAHDTRLVLLAHHRRDQAETLLLQALRGAGVAGLAAMPRMLERDGITWARPWLSQPRDVIEAYVRLHRLDFVEDDSNAQDRFDRNRLRRLVWPHLVEAFPHAEASLASAASRAHDAASALVELATVDLQSATAGGRLDLALWSQLSPARRVNALRSWVRKHTGRLAPATLLTRLCAELPGRRNGRWLLDGGVLRCHRGMLYWETLGERLCPASAREASLRVSRPGLYPLPGWAGTLRATAVEEGGVALALLDPVDLLPRAGAEQFQTGPGRPPRSLKKQYQAASVPAWKRNGPLVYSRECLVFVPGLGIDARAIARPGEAQVSLEWVEAPAPRPSDVAL